MTPWTKFVQFISFIHVSYITVNVVCLYFLSLICLFVQCFKYYPHIVICFGFFFPSHSWLQVVRMQSLQSYHNKAVPSAALFFVYVDRAHLLPVSPVQFLFSYLNRISTETETVRHPTGFWSNMIIKTYIKSFYCVITELKRHILNEAENKLVIWFYVSISLLIQFKKSGKEPKAGAELVFGNTTHRTKVWD